eukprot:scaffold26504_cov56-Phaeocystis_antarctica.AAC.2
MRFSSRPRSDSKLPKVSMLQQSGHAPSSCVGCAMCGVHGCIWSSGPVSPCTTTSLSPSSHLPSGLPWVVTSPAPLMSATLGDPSPLKDACSIGENGQHLDLVLITSAKRRWSHADHVVSGHAQACGKGGRHAHIGEEGQHGTRGGGTVTTRTRG